MSGRRLARLGVLGACAWLAHQLAGRALVDQGGAGALFSQGAQWSLMISAAGLLVLRLAGFVVLACIPVVLVAHLIRPRHPGGRSRSTRVARARPVGSRGSSRWTTVRGLARRLLPRRSEGGPLALEHRMPTRRVASVEQRGHPRQQ